MRSLLVMPALVAGHARLAAGQLRATAGHVLSSPDQTLLSLALDQDTPCPRCRQVKTFRRPCPLPFQPLTACPRRPLLRASIHTAVGNRTPHTARPGALRHPAG